MNVFIENKIYTIYREFMDDINAKRRLCKLKTFRFDGDHIPNYGDNTIQRFYLLKYMPAYLAEYRYIYKHLLELNFLGNNLNIISIGCGCGIDLWGAKFARDYHFPNANIRYTGLDRIDWNYRESLGMESYFIIEDLNNLNRLNEEGYNVIMFPKSLGELDNDTFCNLKKIFRNTVFKTDRIILVSSMRNTRSTFDTNRMREIIFIFRYVHGYNCLDDENEYEDFSKSQFSNWNEVFNDFTYPEYIRKFMSKLIYNCNKFIKNGLRSCEDDCYDIMSKWPITKTSQTKYQILRLEKRVE